MPDQLTLYWLPHCTTCQKAVAYLEAAGHEVAARRDVKAKPLSRKEIDQLAAKVGGASELFSRRAIKYRELKLNERELSNSEMLDLMSTEYTFIKRPVLVKGERAVAGFSAKAYQKFLE